MGEMPPKRSQVRELRGQRKERWAAEGDAWRDAARISALLALLVVGVCLSSASASASPGQLYAFGDNESGELGNPMNNNLEEVVPNPTPVPVILPGEAGPVTQAAAGGNQSLAITASGQLYAFGYNYYGQLGNPSNNLIAYEANPTPTVVRLPGEVGPASEVAAGRYHSLAVTSSGQLYAFGDNNWGQLGNATEVVPFAVEVCGGGRGVMVTW
jgi:alpha-tubulin suppressor-like RCC1 family protein